MAVGILIDLRWRILPVSVEIVNEVIAMDNQLSHSDAIRLITQIEMIIESVGGNEEYWPTAFTEIRQVVNQTLHPKQEVIVPQLAYQVFGPDGEDYNDIVYAPTREAARRVSITHSEHGHSYYAIRAIRRPDLDDQA